jgi:predicted Fe-S protein YdhL (DUF1289 family)
MGTCCAIDGICVGCCRTIDEICRWDIMNDEERERIMQELPKREKEWKPEI